VNYLPRRLLKYVRFLSSVACVCPHLTEQLVNRRNTLRQRYSVLFQSLHLDVILCPASPAPALPFHTSKYWSYTSLFNFLDWPGVVFPTGVQVTLDDQDADYEPRNEDEQHVYSTCEWTSWAHAEKKTPRRRA
jgi:hypothetical protein